MVPQPWLVNCIDYRQEVIDQAIDFETRRVDITWLHGLRFVLD